MDHQAACEGLVAVVQDLPAAFRERGIVRVRAHHVEPAALRLKRLLRGGKALARQERCGQSILRGLAGVKALGHRAEHLLQSDRLGRRERKGPAHLLLVQSEKLSGGGCAAKYTYRTGDVPAGL